MRVMADGDSRDHLQTGWVNNRESVVAFREYQQRIRGGVSGMQHAAKKREDQENERIDSPVDGCFRSGHELLL
jgi:hypothetical protein